MNKFTKEFKLKAIKLKRSGLNPNQIFEENKIKIKDKQKDYACKLINSWKRKGFKIKTRKDLNKFETLSLKEQNEYLKAKVAYLEKENSFLGKLPKKKSN